jgi:hypothetical protein
MQSGKEVISMEREYCNLPFDEAKAHTELPRCLYIEMEPNTDAKLTWIGISLRDRGRRPEEWMDAASAEE